MKRAFKIATVIGSTLLIGISTVFAATAFSPFVQNNTPDFSVVYGDASADAATANSLGTYLNGLVDVSDTTPINIDDGITPTRSGIDKIDIMEGTQNDDLLIGQNIPAESFDDGDIDYLIDGKIEWDDGDDNKNYDVHEEVNIMEDKLAFVSLLDDEDLAENFALTNNKGLSYRYVFDETPDFSKIGTGDADNMKIKFLGKTLDIKNADDNSITVVTSQEVIVSEDQTVTVNGKEIKVEDIFENHVGINGKLVREGKSEKINGLVVEVDTIAYNSNDKPSKALIRVGEDISEEYATDDAYIGEDEEDPRWVWDIDLSAEKPYIGIVYNEKETDSDDDILYAGEGYTYPEGYVALKFDGTTKVDYVDYTLSIDEEELYDSNENKLYDGDDKSVLILEGSEDESINTVGSDEDTSKIYLYYNRAYNNNTGRIESYYYDNDENRIMADNLIVPTDGTITKVAILRNEDTNVDVYAKVDSGYLEMYFDDDGSRQIVARYKLGTTDVIESLGTTAEEAEVSEIKLNHKGSLKSIGEKDYDVINDLGYKVSNPESNAENDEITFSVPSDRVEASISIGKPKVIESTDETTDTETTDTETTDTETTDTETTDTTTEPATPAYTYITSKTSQIQSVKDRNLVIVGGSCINEVSAQLLGGKLCGEEFTAATGVGPGKAIIKTYANPYNASKIAVLVAGYDKADTDRAVAEFKKGTYDLTVGEQQIV